MGYLAERVSYLRGLAAGLSMNKDSAESRLFDEIIELLDDIASSVEGLEEQQDGLADEIGDIEESICDLEEAVFEYEDDEEDEDFVCAELECPNCGAVLPIDEDLLDNSEEIRLVCPGCGEEVSVEIDEEDFCDGCCETCDEDCDEE